MILGLAPSKEAQDLEFELMNDYGKQERQVYETKQTKHSDVDKAKIAFCHVILDQVTEAEKHCEDQDHYKLISCLNASQVRRIHRSKPLD